ncbi:MAG: DUF1501 domain-containing protein, partial [Pirellulaceae bacterium]
MSIIDPRSLSGRHLLSRRASLGNMMYGLSSIAMAGLLQQDSLSAEDPVDERTPIHPVIGPSNPNAKRDPHFPSAAKKVLMIFCSGACSHLDTFDYKPELIKRHG